MFGLFLGALKHTFCIFIEHTSVIMTSNRICFGQFQTLTESKYICVKWVQYKSNPQKLPHENISHVTPLITPPEQCNAASYKATIRPYLYKNKTQTKFISILYGLKNLSEILHGCRIQKTNCVKCLPDTTVNN